MLVRCFHYWFFSGKYGLGVLCFGKNNLAIRGVAQLAEQLIPNQQVVSSSPTAPVFEPRFGFKCLRCRHKFD